MTHPHHHPSHDESEWGHCLQCGMSHEEMCDFSNIPCEDVQRVQMQMPMFIPQLGYFNHLTDIEATHRKLILMALSMLASRQERMRAAMAELDKLLPERFELVEADRPD